MRACMCACDAGASANILCGKLDWNVTSPTFHFSRKLSRFRRSSVHIWQGHDGRKVNTSLKTQRFDLSIFIHILPSRWIISLWTLVLVLVRLICAYVLVRLCASCMLVRLGPCLLVDEWQNSATLLIEVINSPFQYLEHFENTSNTQNLLWGTMFGERWRTSILQQIYF